MFNILFTQCHYSVNTKTTKILQEWEKLTFLFLSETKTILKFLV